MSTLERGLAQAPRNAQLERLKRRAAQVRSSREAARPQRSSRRCGGPTAAFPRRTALCASPPVAASARCGCACVCVSASCDSQSRCGRFVPRVTSGRMYSRRMPCTTTSGGTSPTRAKVSSRSSVARTPAGTGGTTHALDNAARPALPLARALTVPAYRTLAAGTAPCARWADPAGHALFMDGVALLEASKELWTRKILEAKEPGELCLKARSKDQLIALPYWLTALGEPGLGELDGDGADVHAAFMYRRAPVVCHIHAAAAAVRACLCVLGPACGGACVHEPDRAGPSAAGQPQRY
jgi:hypothetical protein